MALIWSPVFDWDDEGWRDQAACRCCDAELFFPTGTTAAAVAQARAAKNVCHSCPVRVACLQFALVTNQEAGIWGGTDEEERRKLSRKWRAGRRRSKSPVRT